MCTKVLRLDLRIIVLLQFELFVNMVDKKEVSLANMVEGATNLLQNENRKVFFILVDPTKLTLKINYWEDIRNAEGDLIGYNVRKKYINQRDIMNKFVSLFELPENQAIMSKVDAIHFIVTKADLLGDGSTRLDKARELLISRYQNPIEQLKNYCRKTKRINFFTNYQPQIYTFSLGRFYLGDIFDFEQTEALQFVDVIRKITGRIKKISWWNRFMEMISKGLNK